MNLQFFLNSVLFGVGLAMDAFSVSLSNGLNEPAMPRSRSFLIAGTFALFQMLMPLIGWFCVHTIEEAFHAVSRFIPWIAFLLLLYIGGKMLLEGIRNKNTEAEKATVGTGSLLVQAVATSIDALSVGFTISEYGAALAAAESFIIGLVTFLICLAGGNIGKKAGTRLAGKASILGGIILIAIGIEILLKGIL
ncbi:MAG: manganese efflux pump [Clostridia bacterium]|nr:manganese efflux pump [Clostridia bacterium]